MLKDEPFMNPLTRLVSGLGERHWLVVVFVIAAVLRVGWVTARFSGDNCGQLQFPDEETYSGAARSLTAGEGLVFESEFRAWYMPLYPAFLATFDRADRPLLWARIAQALFGAWVAPATFLLARQWLRWTCEGKNAKLRGTWIACIAGFGAAFDPFLIFFSGLLLTETLFAAVLVTAWAFVLPMCRRAEPIRVGQALVAGLLLWLCVMLRPSAAVLVVLAPMAVALCRRFDRQGLVAGVVMAEIVLIGLIPWAARNRMAIGEWRWLTTRGGISLYDGLGKDATGASDLAHTKTMPEIAGLSEVEWDRCFRSLAWSAVKRDPARAARLGITKFARTWSLTPNAESYRGGIAAVISAAWMSALLLFAAAGWWTYRRFVGPWALLLLPVATFTLLHMVFVGSVRYRVPVMPMMIVLSAAGLLAVAGWFRAPGSGSSEGGAIGAGASGTDRTDKAGDRP